MNTWRFNGEYWYHDGRSVFTRIRQWFAWFGGWERADGSWSFGFKSKWSRFGFCFTGPYPLSLLGHSLTFYSWGVELRLPNGFLVWDRQGEVFLSKDGTPGGAHHWFRGVPDDVIKAAEKRQRDLEEEQKRWDETFERQKQEWLNRSGGNF